MVTPLPQAESRFLDTLRRTDAESRFLDTLRRTDQENMTLNPDALQARAAEHAVESQRLVAAMAQTIDGIAETSEAINETLRGIEDTNQISRRDPTPIGRRDPAMIARQRKWSFVFVVLAITAGVVSAISKNDIVKKISAVATAIFSLFALAIFQEMYVNRRRN